MKKVLAGLLCTAAAALASPAAANLVFATWNIDGGEKTPTALRAHAEGIRADLGRIDVLAVQEVVSEDQVQAVAEGLGLDHWAISDFSPPVEITGKWYESLEVGVLSALPIASAAEWDLTGRKPNGDVYPPRLSSVSVASEELPLDLDLDLELEKNVPSRGFLRVDLEGGWSIFAVHWKSSRGESWNAEDLTNARQRENQAAGLVACATEALGRRPDGGDCGRSEHSGARQTSPGGHRPFRRLPGPAAPATAVVAQERRTAATTASARSSPSVKPPGCSRGTCPKPMWHSPIRAAQSNTCSSPDLAQRTLARP